MEACVCVCVSAEGDAGCTLQDICTWMRPVLGGEVGTPWSQLAAVNKAAWAVASSGFQLSSLLHRAQVGKGAWEVLQRPENNDEWHSAALTPEPCLLRSDAPTVLTGRGSNKPSDLNADRTPAAIMNAKLQMLTEAQESITITITCEPWTKAESQMRRAGCNTLCNLYAHSGWAALCHLGPVGLFECEIACWRLHFRAFHQLKSLNYLDMDSYPQPRATLRTVGGEFKRQSEKKKKKDHYIYFSAGPRHQIVSLFAIIMIPNVRHLIVISLLFSSSGLCKKKKKKKGKTYLARDERMR